MPDDASDLGGEVRLGSMLFTLVEPHRGHEVAYHRWYERDHFYAGCMVGPWLFAGRRWVATRDLKALRFGSDVDRFGGAARGSYLAVYWILDGRHDDHVDWALRQVHWLHANGRMFAERDHVHTLMYRREADAGSDGVPPELALDHPYGGLVATLVRPDPTASAEDLVRWLGADLALAFSPVALDPDAPVSQQGLDDIEACTLLLTFTAGSPAHGWETHRQTCDGLPGEVLWSSGFLPTVPGSDRYVDELW